MKFDDLTKGSFILFIMINFFNFLNYVFHFLMARLLGPVDYGILATLFSLMYIFAIPSEAIQTVITSYVSRLKKNDFGKIKFILFKILSKTFVFAFFAYLMFLPVAVFLFYFLNIDYYLFLITGLSIFFFFMLPVLRGALQGRKRFISLGLTMVGEGIFKVLFSVLLVLIGWKVYGAMSALIIALGMAFILCFILLTDILKSKSESTSFDGIFKYSIPYFVSILAILLFYSLDIILAKRFFSPEVAGKYSVVSMLGKMIFLGTVSTSKAMFPVISEQYNQGKRTIDFFKRSLKIVLFTSGIALILFLFFPHWIVNIFFGSVYSEIAQVLFLTGLSYTALSLTNLVVLYGLSIDKIKTNSLSLLGFVLLQVVGFYLFHGSLFQYSLTLFTINILFLAYSVLIVQRYRENAVRKE